MSRSRNKYDRQFREGAVRIIEETGKPIAQVARDLGVNEGTLGNWVNRARVEREGRGELSPADYEELKALRAEVAELRMERDVLKRARGYAIFGRAGWSAPETLDLGSWDAQPTDVTAREDFRKFILDNAPGKGMSPWFNQLPLKKVLRAESTPD